MVEHYKSINVNAKEKPFGFTDGNDVDSAISIKEYVTSKGYKCWFGIGTHMSNDYPGSPACNIVIKLTEVEVDERWLPVVKLSDTPSKASGDPDMVRIAMNIHCAVPLDDPSHAERKAPYAEPVPNNAAALSARRRSNAARHLDRLAALG
jgi:nicotinate phosphoribosyltransferase